MLATTLMMFLCAQSPSLEQPITPAAATTQQAQRDEASQQDGSTVHRMLLVASGAAVPVAAVSVLVGLGALLATGGIAILRFAVPDGSRFNTPLLAAAGVTTTIGITGLVIFAIAAAAVVVLGIASQVID